MAADKDKEKKKEIEAIIDEYEKRLEQKEAENAVLRERLKNGEKETAGEGNIGKPKAANSRNSSTPPSQDPTHPTIPNNRTKSGNPQGGQKGHLFHPRKKYMVNDPVMLPDPKEVQEHPDDYYFVREIRKQKVSVHLVVEVTEYVSKEYRHHKNRKLLHTEFPDDVGHLEVNYDATVDALTSYLHTVANVPYNKIQEMLQEATDGELQISVGTLAEREKLFSEMTDEERQKIATELLAGKYMNVDGTMIRSNGKQRQILIMRNKDAVLFKMTGCKGNKAVEGTPAERYKGIVVTDSEATFMKLGSKRQACLIHELRYLVRAREDMPELTWHNEMHTLITELIDTRNREFEAGKTSMSPGKRKENEKRWDEITAKGCMEMNKLFPGLFATMKTDSTENSIGEQAADQVRSEERKKPFILPNGTDLTKDVNLLKRLISRKNECLLFLTDYSIPHHNNDAEKSARTAKTHSKPNGGMRSDQYAGYYADTASVLETERLKHRSRYEKLKDVFGKRTSNAKVKMREALRKHREERELTPQPSGI